MSFTTTVKIARAEKNYQTRMQFVKVVPLGRMSQNESIKLSKKI